MNIKVGLKIGSIEFNFEGTSEVFEARFGSVFDDLVEFGKTKFEASEHGQLPAGSKSPSVVSAMTVKAIASKLGGESGNELLYAVVASLGVVRQKETFTRQEILDEMKSAVGYYKPTYSGNLTGYLDGASKKGIIIETSKDVYALKDSARAEMEQRLAQ